MKKILITLGILFAASASIAEDVTSEALSNTSALDTDVTKKKLIISKYFFIFMSLPSKVT